GVLDVREKPRLVQQFARPVSFSNALFAESDVDPAGEQVLLIPVAVAVAEQDECVWRRHASTLAMPRTAARNASSGSTGCAGPRRAWAVAGHRRRRLHPRGR